MQKERIAEYAGRISNIALDISNNQLQNRRVNKKQKFFLGIIARQGLLLRDIRVTLEEADEQSQMSTFILLRCLMDDFLMMLYFASNNFDDKSFHSHTAEAINNYFKTIKQGANINERFFQNREEGLPTFEYYETEYKAFCSDNLNNMYFKDIKRKTFKSFIKTSNLVDTLPDHEITRANAPAIVLWKLLSTYVHYSIYTIDNELRSSRRSIEIQQIPEALTYIFKTILLASTALNSMGMRNVVNDPTNILQELHTEIEEEQ